MSALKKIFYLENMVYYRHKNCMGKIYQHECLRNCKNKVNNY